MEMSMRIIRKSSGRKQAVICKPVTIKDYKLSAFCIEEHTSEGVLLCHTATGEILLLTNEEYRELSSGKELTSNWARIMADRLFLVSTAQDEYAMVDRDRHAASREKAGNMPVTSYTILPTSQCNARCFYCYEKDIPQKNMSVQTAIDTADFIAQYCCGEKVHITWFGGEPTVAHPIISLICKRLDDKGVEYSSGMISNGLLLDKEMIQTAKVCWKLEHIQITIDGTEKIYNETKNYKGSIPNPFEIVLANITHLLKNNIHISIRINLGQHNYDDVVQLIHLLNRRFSEKKLLSVYVHTIDNVYDEEIHGELIEKSFELNQLLITLGMHSPAELPSLRLHSCMADSDDALLINPDGQLGKCEHYAFDKQIGSIYSEERNESVIAEWKEKAAYEFCSRCPLYASCFQLKWCNGGLPCSESAVKSKIASIRNSMRMVYIQWKQKCQRMRTDLVFALNGTIDVRLEAGAIYADFYENENQQIRETRQLNSVACTILRFLQDAHSFQDIAVLLMESYSGDSDFIGQILEDYLLESLHDGLIISQIKENA